MSHCLDVRKNINHLDARLINISLPSKILCRQSGRAGVVWCGASPLSFSAGISPPSRRQSPHSRFIRGTVHSSGGTPYVPIVCARDHIGASFLCARRLNQDRVPRFLRYAPPHSRQEFPNRLPILALSTPFFVTFNNQMERQPIIVVYVYISRKMLLRTRG